MSRLQNTLTSNHFSFSQPISRSPSPFRDVESDSSLDLSVQLSYDDTQSSFDTSFTSVTSPPQPTRRRSRNQQQRGVPFF